MTTSGTTAPIRPPSHSPNSGASMKLIASHEHPDRDSSTSVAKALALLSSFTPHRPRMGVSELARRARLPKSTAHRLLAVLVEWDMVHKHGTEYSPGARLSELSVLAERPDTQDLRRVALPHLLDLYEMTHETVNLCVLAGQDALYVDKIHGHNSVDSPACVGGRLPAANTAVGKALLAFSNNDVLTRVADNLRPATSSSIASPLHLARELATVRQSGIAYDRQETKAGMTCIAAPVRGWTGAVVAAVSISGPVHRFRPTSAVPAIRMAAAGIAKLAQEANWERQCSGQRP